MRLAWVRLLTNSCKEFFMLLPTLVCNTKNTGVIVMKKYFHIVANRFNGFQWMGSVQSSINYQPLFPV